MPLLTLLEVRKKKVFLCFELSEAEIWKLANCSPPIDSEIATRHRHRQCKFLSYLYARQRNRGKATLQNHCHHISAPALGEVLLRFHCDWGVADNRMFRKLQPPHAVKAKNARAALKSILV